MDFEEYVAVRGQSLLRLAYLFTGDQRAAEDLVQTALVKVYRRWPRVARADHPDAYVRKVIANAYVDHRRRRSNGETAADAAIISRLGPVVADHADTHADRDELWRALMALPRKQRAVLVLRFYEDCDDHTIAEVLRCSEGTVRSNASRALATLRSTFPSSPRGGRTPAPTTTNHDLLKEERL